MKSTYFMGFILTVVLPVVSFSQTKFESVAIPMMKKAVKQSFKKVSENKSCAKSGTQDYDNVTEDRGSALNSSEILTTLLENVEGNRSYLYQDRSQCGSCEQVNQVALYTTTEPIKTISNESCNNRPTINIQKELDDDDVQQFAASTVRGKTPEGKKAYQGCPDPCSFSIASATTSTKDGKSLLNLTIHCGAPKSGSVFSAKYRFTAGLIHKWSCQ